MIDNGRNPMIADLDFANLIWPLLALTGLDRLFIAITPTSWLGVLRALFYTLLLALIVQVITRRKFMWRT